MPVAQGGGGRGYLWLERSGATGESLVSILSAVEGFGRPSPAACRLTVVCNNPSSAACGEWVTGARVGVQDLCCASCRERPG